MAITSMDQLTAALPGQHRHIFKVTIPAQGTGAITSLWKAAGQPGAGANPPTGDGHIPAKDTAGAIPFTNPAVGKQLFLARFFVVGATVGTLVLYDRLWANSGFNGTLATPQTIATPPVLTRPDALGDDVELWMEVYANLGATGITATASYTNQAGESGRSATATVPASMNAWRMVQFGLQAGDTGVRTVASVTLSATTGTAGDFGLVLLRRVAELGMPTANIGVDRDAFALGMPRVFADACLAMMVHASTTNTGNVISAIELIEG